MEAWRRSRRRSISPPCHCTRNSRRASRPAPACARQQSTRGSSVRVRGAKRGSRRRRHAQPDRTVASASFTHRPMASPIRNVVHGQSVRTDAHRQLISASTDLTARAWVPAQRIPGADGARWQGTLDSDPRRTANGERRTATANGDGKRRRQTATANGDGKRRRQTATANGDGKRRRQTATANGDGKPRNCRLDVAYSTRRISIALKPSSAGDATCRRTARHCRPLVRTHSRRPERTGRGWLDGSSGRMPSRSR